jgi:AAA domain
MVESLTIPRELKYRPQWVIWRRERDTKIPRRARSPGRQAKSNDPKTWAKFSEAVEASERAGADGIGFVVTEHDPYTGIDLDHCYVDERLHPDAAAIIERLASYSEISPSGEGVRIFIKASLNGRRNQQTETSWGGNFEAYDTGRFLTVTGNALPDSPAGIAERQDELDQLLSDIFTSQQGADGDWEPLDVDLIFEGVEPGARDDAAYKYASSMRARNFRKVEARNEMHRAWEQMGQPEQDKYPLETALEKIERVWREKPAGRSAEFEQDVAGERWVVHSLADAFAWASEPIDWVVPELLAAGEKGMIAGPAKSLKTWLALHMGHSIATGGTVLDEKQYQVTEPQAVLFVQEEGQRQRWGRRIEAVFEGDPNAPFHFTHRAGFSLLNRKHVAWVIDRATAINARVVFLDPMQRVTPGVNENDAAEVGPAWDAIHRIATEAGAAVIVIHHSRKGGGSPSMDSIRGSGRHSGEVDLMFVLRKDERGTLECFLEGRELTRADSESGILEIKYEADAPHRMRFAGVRINIKGPVNTTRPAVERVLRDAGRELDTGEIQRQVEERLGKKRDRTVIRDALGALADDGKITEIPGGKGKASRWEWIA